MIGRRGVKFRMMFFLASWMSFWLKIAFRECALSYSSMPPPLVKHTNGNLNCWAGVLNVLFRT